MVMNCEDDRNDNGLSNFSDMGLRFLAKGCPMLRAIPKSSYSISLLDSFMSLDADLAE